MNVDFITAIKLFFANYVNFRGRSTRAEYWFSMLFTFVVSLALSVLGLPILSNIFALAIFLPSLAITFRRFHDTGKSGWWAFGLWLATVICVFISCAPLIPTVLKYANDPESLGSAIVPLFSEHIGTFITCNILAFAIGIWQIVILATPSGPDNKYGPNPYGEIDE